ncbi:hypothetical protein HJG60_009595 [Phyllostomus discolor]|uniref:Uncharacterized protein n=1 Tax=Phyllostomus discolor TaxID=89673 RepID=A0A833YI36_9CHIR|nr:hypothetical protein HJG60_009595 [Phyllostomus discolor]
MVPLPHTYPARQGIALASITSKTTALHCSQRAWCWEQVNPLLPTHPPPCSPFCEVSALHSGPGGRMGSSGNPQVSYLSPNTPELRVGPITVLWWRKPDSPLSHHLFSSCFPVSFREVQSSLDRSSPGGLRTTCCQVPSPPEPRAVSGCQQEGCSA